MLSLLLLSVLATPSAPQNALPVCVTNADFTVTRQGPTTKIQLDGSFSYDDDGDPLLFEWTACPGSSFSDATTPVTTLTLDTPTNTTYLCGVRLVVTDGKDKSFCRLFVTVEPGPLTPPLDIEPGCCPNVIKTKGCGSSKVTVALVYDGQFNPQDVDIKTLELFRPDGVGAIVVPWYVKISDVATPYVGGLCGCHKKNGDCKKDLVVTFSGSKVVKDLYLDKEKNGADVKLALRGKLLDGRDFVAEDCVHVKTK
ncbi:MAG: PKD domain-containing protein [Planctomycetes bacterium]|nr:PKD domain-containing protein [Planctomycetota bacterium]